VRVKGANPRAHVTERIGPLNDDVHPLGGGLAENVIGALNPLIGVTTIVDVAVTVAKVVIAEADNEKS